MCGALRIDERHRPFDDFFVDEEAVLNRRDHVDECVADCDDVVGQGRVAREVDWRHVGKP